ncbi:uncharacterized protein LOC108630803 isoform X2 [Ceratina calcarata]|uniref:Zinc finger CCHC domain-containing protein 7 n=1 Tax=Ceratina calcarata TaxID=156304 RepID=A0AAJ7JC44_9HYME|nr:uncharacterized protein LOC108630803 isoform X2 [Ceratina calcarata]
MEFNVFRDYCKAENSDDEETNRDIQSRLYSKIYYSSIGSKADVKPQTSTTDNDNLHKDVIVDKTSGPCNTPVKSNFTKDSRKVCSSIDSGSSKSNETESKPDVTSIDLENTSETLPMKVGNKSKLNTSLVSDENIQFSKDQIVCCNTDNIDRNSKSYNTGSTENIHVKTESESNNEGKSSEHEHVNHQNPTICIVNGNLQDPDNILNKYKFSKSFINNLYQKKYHHIEKRLQEIAENKEQARVKVNEANDQQEDSDKCKMNQQQEELDRYKKAISQLEEHTKYDTSSKTQKVHTVTQEISLVSDSDSEESILEVPIPPKPQPPVIQLQDSDDQDSDTSTDVDMDIDYSFIRTNKTYLPKVRERDARSDDTEDSTSTIIDGINDMSSLGDIMLNCTAVQKGASSIKEIMEMIQNVQSEQPKSSNEGREHSNECEIENSTESSHLLQTGKDNETESQLPSEAVTDSNIVYERDKSESINYAEDEMISNFSDVENIEKVNMEIVDANSRKRHFEDESEPSTSAIKETECTETKRLKMSPEIRNDEDYFFRPMSDELKAFYNESKGQENFDVKEIQSKMSNEDLMPGLFKTTKLGNKRCTNCNQFGHMKHSCSEPQKIVLCYICGKDGHKETRCPQKMCLTCGKKQNTFRKTCETCSKLYCNTCKAVGHVSTKCPDLWRRFHQTTTITEVNAPKSLSQVMKPANSLYCCNCTKRGHESSTCKEYRWSQHFPTPAFVSNYNELNETSTKKESDPDVIPLKKQKTCLIFTDEDLEGCRIVYAYGTFRTTKSNGEERIRKLCNAKLIPSDVESFMQGKVSPTFLDQFRQLVEFEVRVYYDLNKEPTIRIRSLVGHTRLLLEVFLFWLQLDDKDKTLSFLMHIPRNFNILIPFLDTKLKELTTNLKNPNCIWHQIKKTEKSLSEAADNIMIVRALSAKLIGARLELLKVFLTKPKFAKPVTKLKQIIKRHSKGKGCRSNGKMTTPSYLAAIINYNKIFLPRALKEGEVKCFLTNYNKSERKKQQNDCKEPNTESKCKEANTGCKKSQKKKKCNKNAYEQFIDQIRQSNMARQAANRNKNKAPNRVQPQRKCRIVTAPVERTLNNIQSDNEAAIRNMESNIIEITDVDHTDSMQSSHDQNIANDNVTNTVSTNVTSSEDNTTKQSEVIGAVETGSLQEQSGVIDSTPTSAKKKKSKKGKKGNSLGITENPIATIELSLQSKANQLTAEALKFELPYMNKAVDEIRKRINDKSLKQEHIDTLQRLVNMENDHRKYVSAFCNYLQ